MTMIMRKDLLKDLKESYDQEPMCIFWNSDQRQFAYLIKEDISGLIKEFVSFKSHGVKSIDKHLRTKECEGKTYYGMTLQSYKDDKIDVDEDWNTGGDGVSTMLFGWMCSGIAYWFTDKKIRDSFHKLMSTNE